MSWNRLYRPQRLCDLHLRSVREYFTSLLTAPDFPQVFLFTGPKGTGKTSTARILAAVLNDPQNAEAVKQRIFSVHKKKTSAKSIPLQEPNAQDSLVQSILWGNSYVVHELDAASNRGVDDIRALKERISLPPAQGVMSVYILDEVHMLTTEAFNALLKVLEEPPEHVIFILATTEFQKIVPTVVSRCQVIKFQRASTAELFDALQNIIKQEKLTAEPAVLEAICQKADGSFRDAVKLLELIHQQGELTSATAEKVLHSSHTEIATKIISELLAKNTQAVVQLFQTARQQGVSADALHTYILEYVYAELLKALGVTKESEKISSKVSIFLLKEFSDSALHASCPIPLLPLELKCLDLLERSTKKGKEPSDSEPPITASTPHVSKKSEPSAAIALRTDTTPPHTLLTPGDGNKLCDDWSTVLDLAVKTNFGLATLLKSARPVSGSTGKLTLSVFYKFHQEQLQQPKFYALIQEVFSRIAGGSIELECLLSEEPSAAELKEPISAAPALAELAVASLM